MSKTVVVKTFKDQLEGNDFDQTVLGANPDHHFASDYTNTIFTTIKLTRNDLNKIITLLSVYDVVNVALLRSSFRVSFLPPKRMKLWYMINLLASVRFKRIISEPLSDVFGVRNLAKFIPPDFKFTSLTKFSLIVKYHAFQNKAKFHEITLDVVKSSLDFDFLESLKFIIFTR